jgi:N-acetylglutamate synthase-like GNAT family acetyltransferase
VNIEIREARSEDLEAVLSLLELLYKGDVGRGMRSLLEEYLASPQHVVLLACAGAEQLGLLIGSYRLDIDWESRAGLVDAVVTSESARKKGVGRALLLRFRDWARGRGCSALQVVNPNEGFFARMGFSDREARFWQASLSDMNEL